MHTLRTRILDIIASDSVAAVFHFIELRSLGVSLEVNRSVICKNVKNGRKVFQRLQNYDESKSFRW